MNEDYEALKRGAGILELSARGRIAVRGRDRARLLHNLTSNEVKKMTPGSGCYAFLLSVKGRIEADLYLWCFAEHFLIDTEPELREKAMQHIRRYIIADQVELEDVTAQTAAIGVEGPGAAAVLGVVGAPICEEYTHVAWGEHTVAGVTSTGQPGFRIYCAASEAGGIVERLEAAGAKRVSAETARVVRVENGKPRYGEDIRETSLAQETQQMHAVSFNKGCYLGQEIVERVRSQGHVNKKLVRLELEGAEPVAPGTKLKAGDADAGEVTSAVFSPELGKVAAMGYVRTAFTTAGTVLRAGEVAARVR
jgi:folate-binding protein YgfZ